MLSGEIGQQRLGLLQICGVKALGEATIERGEEIAGCRAFTLAVPEQAQPDRGAEFKGPGPLAPGQGQSVLETGFGLGVRPPAARVRRHAPGLQEQCSPHPMQLGLPQARLLRVEAGQHFG